jgi:hypothetical protein
MVRVDRERICSTFPDDLKKQLTYSLVMIFCIETYTFRILPPRKFVKEEVVMYERGIRGEPLAARGGISETVRLYPHFGEYIRTRISSDVNELTNIL